MVAHTMFGHANHGGSYYVWHLLNVLRLSLHCFGVYQQYPCLLIFYFAHENVSITIGASDNNNTLLCVVTSTFVHATMILLVHTIHKY